MALGEHLRADKNIERAGGKRPESFLILPLGARGVAVESRDARAGKFLAQAFFQMFGAFAEKINVLGLALWAEFRDGLERAAIVAFEAVALLMMRHGNAAIDALHRGAAAAAQHGPGVSPTIDQDERLRSVCETFLNSGVELGGNRASLMRLLKLFAQVDNFDVCEGAVGD